MLQYNAFGRFDMTNWKSIGCLMILAALWSTALAQQRRETTSGEITFKNGKKQTFTSFSNGYSSENLQYLEEMADFNEYSGLNSGASVRAAKLSSLANIEFVEMTKEERNGIDAAAAARKVSYGVPFSSSEFRKANITLQNRKKLEGVFVPFMAGAKWSDGSVEGDPRDQKIVSITFTR